MQKPLIEIENLSKAFRIGSIKASPDTLVGAAKQLATAPFRNLRRLNSLNTSNAGTEDHQVLWAVKDINLEINYGDVLGVIGHNGAGKSTLLKIISRITDPTHGRVTLRGRVSSLLEVGTGFHPELTGRENVYMNGSILGMTKKEIDRNFDAIIDFAGIEKFLDTPTKHYSSGMQTRLAFSVAAHLEPEILIVDEVLAVGDAGFQKKCMGKMQDVSSSGRTVVFVSHNLGAIESICNRGIVMQHGTQEFMGDIKAATKFYRKQLYEESQQLSTETLADRSQFIRSIVFEDENRTRVNYGQITKPLRIVTTIDFGNHNIRDLRISIGIDDLAGNHVVNMEPSISSEVNGSVNGEIKVSCDISELSIAPGAYSLWYSLKDGREILEQRSNLISLNIEDGQMFNEGRSFFRGACVLRTDWSYL